MGERWGQALHASIQDSESWSEKVRAATTNLNQAKSNILPQNFLTGCFLSERIETQNLGKDQTFPTFPAVALQVKS